MITRVVDEKELAAITATVQLTALVISSFHHRVDIEIRSLRRAEQTSFDDELVTVHCGTSCVGPQ
jgi:hypothetical protein